MSRKKFIVLVCGYKRSGKSTVTQWLGSSYAATTFSIMDPLWQIVQQLYDFTDDELHAKEQRDERGLVPREQAIELSRILKDVLGENLWIREAISKVALGAAGLYVIEGIRLPREVEAFRAACGNEDIVVVKTVCEDDVCDGSDLERAVDDIAADVLVPWCRPADATQARGDIVRAALGTFIEYVWQPHPEWLDFFEPKEQREP